MARPVIHGLSAEEQQQLYDLLRHYNEGREPYRVSGAYLMVLPHDGKACYTLWFYSPQVEKAQLLYLEELSESVHESFRKVSTQFFYSNRKLFLVEYNEKHMATKGDDLIGFGKYRGHYLHEVFRIDPSYLMWIAKKYTPKIPKQERFVRIAQAYVSVYLDLMKQKSRQEKNLSRYLGKKGETLKDISFQITHIRLQDDPYKTRVAGSVTYFYVAQVLYLKDRDGNRAIASIPALYPSMMSGQLSAMERAFRIGEVVHLASARISQTFQFKGVKYTRLNYVRLSLR